ncbi:hypothetical protein BASA81_000346 [Batrachochytrium salamandrivorans]|nr:hypothetical protein BASA81_000346 [Batrachochytrium salamandrivorans]
MRVSVNKNQKAAWNATMREEVGIVSKQQALEEAKAKGRPITTRSSNKGALKSSSSRQNVHGGISELYYKRLARLERLELTNSWDLVEKGGKQESTAAQDEDYSSGGEEEENSGEGREEYRPAKKSKRQPRPTPATSASHKKTSRLFLAEVLLKDGNSMEFVNAMARKPVGRSANAVVCEVTGRPGRYKDPVTGLWVADARALAMLREQVPGWLKHTAISPYWDAIQTLQPNFGQ